MSNFLPCSTFNGAKVGYVFKTTSDFGTGYYKDTHLGTKRSREDDDDNGDKADGASSSSSSSSTANQRKRSRNETRQSRLLAEAEKNAAASSASLQQLDETTLKRTLLTFENNQPGCEDQTVTKNIIIYGDTEVITITAEYESGSVVARFTAESNRLQTSNLAIRFTNLIGKTTGGNISFVPTVTIPQGLYSGVTVLTATTEDYNEINRAAVSFSDFTFNGL